MRTFNPATGALGAQRTVNLYDDAETGERIPFAISDLTGIFFDPSANRLYYTVFNNSQLFYRYFTPESGVERFSTARGATAPFGRWRSTGESPSLRWVVSDDGTWRYRAIFVPNM